MLLMVRLFLVAAGMVTVALAMTARGLVPEPEVRTNIGVVPSVGRELVQLAVVPPTQIARLTVDPTLSGASRLGRIVVAPLPELAASPPTSETPDVPPTREQASAVGAAGVAQLRSRPNLRKPLKTNMPRRPARRSRIALRALHPILHPLRRLPRTERGARAFVQRRVGGGCRLARNVY